MQNETTSKTKEIKTKTKRAAFNFQLWVAVSFCLMSFRKNPQNQISKVIWKQQKLVLPLQNWEKKRNTYAVPDYHRNKIWRSWRKRKNLFLEIKSHWLLHMVFIENKIKFSRLFNTYSKHISLTSLPGWPKSLEARVPECTSQVCVLKTASPIQAKQQKPYRLPHQLPSNFLQP